MKNVYLYLVVAVGGAAVLALEILGTRILGPFYGVSLFLWSALITVTLAALSAGYLIGGRVADKGATFSHIASMMTIAGLWVMMIPWIKHPFLMLAEPFGLRGAVLAASVALLFLPLLLLGMLSPIAIRLRAESLAEVGQTAGNLYAISTLASVVSALVTGFYLIPNVGVTRLLIIIALSLIVTGVIGFFLGGRRKTGMSSLSALIFLLVVLLFKFPQESAAPAEGLLVLEQSPYAELRVLDMDGERHLLLDGGIHTLADTNTWASSLHYAAVMDIPEYLFQSPGKLLLIGLGGGSIAKRYAASQWKIDAVEIDPKVIDCARTWFHLLPAEAAIHELDGRQYLRSVQTPYDIILLDAFGSSSVPFHLVTVEAFNEIASHLNEGGVFALNVQTVGWNDPMVITLVATLKQCFSHVVVLPIEEPPDRFGNIVLLAANAPLSLKREFNRNVTLDPSWRYGPDYQIVHAWDNQFTPDIGHARILTDDLNPIDVQAERIAIADRQELHEYFRENGLSW